jgi:hypothetical protein
LSREAAGSAVVMVVTVLLSKTVCAFLLRKNRGEKKTENRFEFSEF